MSRVALGQLIVGLILACGVSRALGQGGLLVEDFEFASSDRAAAAGIEDLTDFANSPSFYISGADENASEGLFSIGTDAVFCQLACEPGSFIGFRRWLDPTQWPDSCTAGEHFAPLQLTYGDPAHPGPLAPDFELDDLSVVCDAYGDGGFADGVTGTHFWVNLVDCEGEIYQFVNHSEASLYSEFWTFNVIMGRTFARLAPESLIDVPQGDRLLTEVAAVEVLIQDADNPPTTIGKWYIDNLRVVEPGGLSAVGIASRYLAVTPAPGGTPVAILITGTAADPTVSCFSSYVDANGDFAETPVFMVPSEWGTLAVTGAAIRPDTSYLVQLDSGTTEKPDLSTGVTAMTAPAGEIDGSLGVDIEDALCVLDGFAGAFIDCDAFSSDISPCATDRHIDLDDLLTVFDALGGITDGCPAPCP